MGHLILITKVHPLLPGLLCKARLCEPLVHGGLVLNRPDIDSANTKSIHVNTQSLSLNTRKSSTQLLAKGASNEEADPSVYLLRPIRIHSWLGDTRVCFIPKIAGHAAHGKLLRVSEPNFWQGNGSKTLLHVVLGCAKSIIGTSCV